MGCCGMGDAEKLGLAMWSTVDAQEAVREHGKLSATVREVAEHLGVQLAGSLPDGDVGYDQIGDGPQVAVVHLQGSYANTVRRKLSTNAGAASQNNPTKPCCNLCLN